MNLGISLFERFIMNKLEYSRLNIQHRMRPEISSLISPAIYPDLVDHPSVSNYPPMRGMDKSVYFIHHSEEEVAFGDSSKKNPHEAKFLVRLAQHLLFNGYAREEITILVAYLGQYYSVREEQRRVNQDGVRCAVLDNYQGEESKIVLLSLVRNNKENSIGFLKIENRVCVALSRAKEGLYIMGNMELLCRNSEVSGVILIRRFKTGGFHFLDMAEGKVSFGCTEFAWRKFSVAMSDSQGPYCRCEICY